MRLIFTLLFVCLTVSSMLAQNKKDSQGRKQGVWEKYYPDAKTLIYSGQFKDDIPYGEFKYYYPSGKIKSIVRHEGAKRSYAWFYFENEELMSEGLFRDMKKDSLWKNYNAQGFLLSTEVFKNNKLNGERRVFYIQDQVETGEVKCASIEMYKDSTLEGPYSQYLSSGVKVQEGTYLKGAKHGVWKSFHPNGTLASTIKYRNGKAYGYSYAYDEEGQEIYRTYWLDGDKLTKEDLAKYLEKCRKQGVIPEE